MAAPSRTLRRVSAAVLFAAIIPLVAAIFITWMMFDRVSARYLNPAVGQRLERSLDLYLELSRAIKDGMRYETDAIAAREPLRAAAILRHEPSIRQELQEVFPKYPNLVSLGVIDADGTSIAEHNRGTPIDTATERRLEVRRPLSDKEGGPELYAVFATSRAKFDELESAAEFVQIYKNLEKSRGTADRGFIGAYAALVGFTVLGAITVGALIARGVTKRIAQLAQATQAVGAGDLTVRAPVSGNDEITDLARAFNSMLLEVERSRARIEFLQRMGTWQEMARRLAHEIKNPLTPIQLAVQECHRKYNGDDKKFHTLLDTTLEIVEEEVGTLRRLVGEFSAFARLPRAELTEGDMSAFLREQRDHMTMFADDETARRTSDADLLEQAVQVSWKIPDSPLKANVDRQMLHRVMVNLVRNAAQAIRDDKGTGHIQIALQPVGHDWISVEVHDDGPGIPEEMRESVFDPYVTTKEDGTGLGLAIVKKVIMEHGGVVEMGSSPLGGACVSIRLPRAGSPAALVALDPVPSSSPPSSRFPFSRRFS